MNEVLRAVFVINWRDDSALNCPYCRSNKVAAVKNDFFVNGEPSDLMVCLCCEKLYLLFDARVLKGMAKQQAAYPNEFTVSIEDDIDSLKEEVLSRGLPRLARVYGPLIISALKKGPVRYSEFLLAHPLTLNNMIEVGALHGLFVCADDFFSGVCVCPDGKFEVNTQDGYKVSGDDVVISVATNEATEKRVLVAFSIYARPIDPIDKKTLG